MVDRPRLSIASSTGLKVATVAAQFKRLFNQAQSTSSLSKYILKNVFIDFFLFEFSLVLMMEKKIELNLKIY